MFSDNTAAATQAHLEAARTALEGGRLEAAAVSLRAALGLMPILPEPHYHLGNVLFELGHSDEAESEYILAARHAADQKRRYAEPYIALGQLADHQRNTGKAVMAYANAVRIVPGTANLIQLGEAQIRHNDYAAALVTMQKALLLDKTNNHLRGRIAHTLIYLGRPKAAAALCAETLRSYPDDPDAHNMQGLALMVQGRLATGFADYAWRWKTAYFARTALQTGRPVWAAEEPSGKAILVYAEQGAGDSIQFARFLTVLAQRGVTVIAAMPRPLMRLIATVPGVAAVHDIADRSWPKHDYVVSILDLAGLLMENDNDLPSTVPYLKMPSGIGETAKENGLSIGIAWACNPDNITARVRNVDPAALMPLSAVEGIRYVSLQQDKTLPKPFAAMADGAFFADFFDTARAIERLDAVISADTSVAHLAGALGKPVFILLPAVAEWRWGESGQASQWYPTARLYRQKKQGEWTHPVAALCSDLQNLAKTRD